MQMVNFAGSTETLICYNVFRVSFGNIRRKTVKTQQYDTIHENIISNVIKKKKNVAILTILLMRSHDLSIDFEQILLFI